MRRTVLAWLLFSVAFIGVWEFVLVAGLVSPAALARPSEVAAAIPLVLAPRGNGLDVLSTVSRSLLAFVLSVPLGVAIGLGIFFAGRMRPPSEFGLDFLRSIPATALVPVFLILYGIGDVTKVAVGAFSSTLVVALGTVVGLRGRNGTRLGVANVLGLRGFRRVLLLDIPEAAPQMFLGLRTGISLALILVVVAEMLIGSNAGLGKVIADMRYTDDKGRMYAAIVVAGLIGWTYNRALIFVENTVLHWRGK